MVTSNPSRYAQSFLYALAIAVVIFLPFVIYDGGYFVYYGDFNVQQIPFYKLAHEAVRSGDWYWSWYTDLGANFFGSYSFYLLFSPFFWLTLPFPTAWLPFFMAPLLALKTACASLTAYCYLERFVKDKAYALIGALLYAFSGWMAFNIFFNHFHEVAVFFPLLLLGVEKLVSEDKKGFFAIMVAINAMVNYWFFVGEAVFVVLYIFVRMTDKRWRMSMGKFVRIAFEAVLGVGCVTVVLLPSVLALMGNPRTGADELLMGWNFWLYWHEQRQPAILQSFFFPPELPARPNFLPDHGAKWASLSAWLPLLSMAGVIAYFIQRRNDWLKKILALCFVCAMVPGLNSLFILLNNSYYARWFYMPVLLMALASVRALEDCEDDTEPFRRAIRWTGLVLVVFTVMCGLTPNKEDDEFTIGLASDIQLMWIYAALALAFLAMTAIIVLHFRRSPRFKTLLGGGVALVSVAFTIFFMANGKINFERSRFIVNTAIGGRELISLPDDGFVRSDMYDGNDNMLMFWHLPNIQAFHSIVPASIMEFYPKVGVKRDVGSRPEADYFALRPLLSVRWLFIQTDKEEQFPMPGYVKHSEQVGFNVYENENFIPMGFAYDRYVTPEQLEDVEKNSRSNLMLRAIVLEEESARRNRDILRPYDVTEAQEFSANAMAEDAAARNEYTCNTFEHDRLGFTATSHFDAPQLLFFSVPWEKGWSAQVNSQPAQIERANVGFMAVRVPAGDSVIRFSYRTPGLYEGAAVSGGFIVVLLLYLLLSRKSHRKAVERVDLQRSLFRGETVNLTWDEYLALYGEREKQERAARLQQTLNEAALVNIKDELDEEEKTLHFRMPEGDREGNAGEE